MASLFDEITPAKNIYLKKYSWRYRPLIDDNDDGTISLDGLTQLLEIEFNNLTKQQISQYLTLLMNNGYLKKVLTK